MLLVQGGPEVNLLSRTVCQKKHGKAVRSLSTSVMLDGFCRADLGLVLDASDLLPCGNSSLAI